MPEVLSRLESARVQDVRWRSGRVFGLVYDAGDEVERLLMAAHNTYFAENGLNPVAFPSLRKFEGEVVAKTADLLGSQGEVVGNMTSGGTESLLMVVKTARDWARDHCPEVSAPEMLLPRTAHPALEKAGHYFNVKPVYFEVDPGKRADPESALEAISGNTILLVGSAPSYPHGVIDPIPELAKIAEERGVLFHVDACVGGFMLPFLKDLGYPIPPFDFRVEGVTSLSVDLHKYGYAAKGASIILYRDRGLRRYQFFVSTEWPGGVYPSPTMTGTRPAGPIAAAWAIMHYLGREGYRRLAGQVMEAVQEIRDGIESIEGLHIIGNPDMSILAIGSDRYNLYEIGDEMGIRGWHMDRQHHPPSLHLTVSHGHTKVVSEFLVDLQAVVAEMKRPSLHRAGRAALPKMAEWLAHRLPGGVLRFLTIRAARWLGLSESDLPHRSAPVYGMLGTLPNREDLEEIILDVIESWTEPLDETSMER